MTTSTSPVSLPFGQHRASAPVWAFHLFLLRLRWTLAVIGWFLELVEYRLAGQRVTVVAVSLFATLLAVSAVFGMISA
jgi:hypothetical protein